MTAVICIAGQCLTPIVWISYFPFYQSHSINITQLFLRQHGAEDQMLICLFQKQRKPWRETIAQGKTIGVPAPLSSSAQQGPTPLLCQHATDSAKATQSLTPPLRQAVTKIHQQQERKEQDQQKQAPARGVVLGMRGEQRHRDAKIQLLSSEHRGAAVAAAHGHRSLQAVLACLLHL